MTNSAAPPHWRFFPPELKGGRDARGNVTGRSVPYRAPLEKTKAPEGGGAATCAGSSSAILVCRCSRIPVYEASYPIYWCTSSYTYIAATAYI